MLDFQQKRKVRSFAYNRITLLVLGLVVLFVLHSTWSVWQKKRESEKLMNLAEQNVASLEARDTELQAKTERLGTEVGVEEEIRSKFNVAKENENVVVVVPDNNQTASTTNQESFWQKIKRFFGMQ